MIVYKNTVPVEYKDILSGEKIPQIKVNEDFDVLGIKGDNLQSLLGLIATHKNSIRMVYADVPYNTGNNDFIYNDNFNTTDSLNYHSNWISWMLPRLIAVRELLTDNGVMVISIDHNEKRNLENLCVDIFGEKNVLTTASVVSNKGGGGRRNTKDLVTTNEYLVICAKDINLFEKGEGVLDEEKTKDKKPRSLLGYNASLLYDRITLFYPFLIHKKTNSVSTINQNEYDELQKFVKDVCKGYGKEKKYDDELHSKIVDYVLKIENKYNKEYTVIFPKKDGKWGRWVPSYDSVVNKKEPYDVLFVNSEGTVNYWEKVKSFKPMTTTMDNPKYANTNATAVLKKLYGEKTFDTPKSIVLMRDIITSFTNEGDTILDWCAGSNSTYHGFVEANKLQDIERKYIFIQQEENDIDIFTEHSLKRVDVVNQIENLEKNIQLTTVDVMDIEDYFLNTVVSYDKESYIRVVDSINNNYNGKVNKYDMIYKYS
jgi:adenine-specific DNA-methyltransferase